MTAIRTFKLLSPSPSRGMRKNARARETETERELKLRYTKKRMEQSGIDNPRYLHISCAANNPRNRSRR